MPEVERKQLPDGGMQLLLPMKEAKLTNSAENFIPVC